MYKRQVVGSMILDRQAIITAAEILRQDDFYYRQYGTMFQTMVDMNNEGKPVDIVTLQARLKETDAVSYTHLHAAAANGRFSKRVQILK